MKRFLLFSVLTGLLSAALALSGIWFYRTALLTHALEYLAEKEGFPLSVTVDTFTTGNIVLKQIHLKNAGLFIEKAELLYSPEELINTKSFNRINIKNITIKGRLNEKGELSSGSFSLPFASQKKENRTDTTPEQPLFSYIMLSLLPVKELLSFRDVSISLKTPQGNQQLHIPELTLRRKEESSELSTRVNLQSPYGELSVTLQASLPKKKEEITLQSTLHLRNGSIPPSFLPADMKGELTCSTLDAELSGQLTALKGRFQLSCKGEGETEKIKISSAVLSLKGKMETRKKKIKISGLEGKLYADDITLLSSGVHALPVQIDLQKRKEQQLNIFFGERRRFTHTLSFAVVSPLLMLDTSLPFSNIALQRLTLNLKGEGSWNKNGIQTYAVKSIAWGKQLALDSIDTVLNNIAVISQVRIKEDKSYKVTSTLSFNYNFNNAEKQTRSFNGKAELFEDNLRFSGKISDAEKRYQLKTEGGYNLKKLKGKITLSFFAIPFEESTFTAADLHPFLGKLFRTTGGSAEVKGEIILKRDTITPRMTLLLHNVSGTFQNSIPLSGINGAVTLTSLSPPETEESTIAVASVDTGGVKVQNGTIRFRIHSDTLNVYQNSWHWLGGELSSEPFSLPLKEKQINRKEHHLTINVSHLSLNGILHLSTLQNLSGTGSVSGKLPIRFLQDGRLFIKEGELFSDGPGTLRYLSENSSLPTKNNKQVETLVRVLEDFRFSTLKLHLNGDIKTALESSIRIEGFNPAFRNGKAIQLHVNLSGAIGQILQSAYQSYTIPDKIEKRMLQFNQ